MQDQAPVSIARPGFAGLAAKTVVCHTLTYMLMGSLAFYFFHYADSMNKAGSGVRPTTSVFVLLGPALQIFRGVLFAAVFYPFREKLFGQKNGWLLIAWLLIGLGILGTFGAPAGSLEGFIYTTIPIGIQLRGYLEIVTQALLLSVLLFYWVRHPARQWVTVTLTSLYAICVALPILGMFAPKR